jgi:hypothetical protein
VSGLLALRLFCVPLDGRSLLALTLAGGLLVVLSPTDFGQNAGLFAGTLETAEGRIKILVLTYTYAGHVKITVLNNWTNAAPQAAKRSGILSLHL